VWGWSLQFGLGCWLFGNQPAALVDWQSVSSLGCSHKKEQLRVEKKEWAEVPSCGLLYVVKYPGIGVESLVLWGETYG